MKVQNNHDLKVAYEELCFLQKFLPDSKKPIVVKEQILKLKCSIRDYGYSEAPSREIVRDNGLDGYVLKVQLPDWIETKEEAEEYFEENEKITMRLTPWDCSGQAFTDWYKVFNTNGSWRAYHSIGFDV